MTDEVFILQTEDGVPIGQPFTDLYEAQQAGARRISMNTYDPGEACMPPPWVQEEDDVWVLYGTEETLRIFAR